ncbi:cation transporter [Candidatus Peregrinibacteria bacterium]|jgi:cation diffusion facilitator family transporter|nr:cation transporter [Candidatus Peregrinibacteria bacterium]
MKNTFILLVALINFLLFLGKFFIGILSNSVALISDSINSLTDTINSIVVLYATKVSQTPADKGHPAGHGRAQPIAAFFVAIMTAVLAIEIIKEAILKIFQPQIISHEKEAIIILTLTIFIKGILSYFEYQKGKKDKNRALLAMSVESRGDIIISLGAIIGILASVHLNISWADPLIAIVIGIYVFYTGYDIAKENIDFLMGASAKPDEIRKIKETLKNIREIKDFHDLRTQHLGEKLQVTVHCHVYKEHSVIKWHDIETKISDKLEEVDIVERAFVHLDPVEE